MVQAKFVHNIIRINTNTNLILHGKKKIAPDKGYKIILLSFLLPINYTAVVLNPIFQQGYFTSESLLLGRFIFLLLSGEQLAFIFSALFSIVIINQFFFLICLEN